MKKNRKAGEKRERSKNKAVGAFDFHGFVSIFFSLSS
jgi:hypothetical protein